MEAEPHKKDAEISKINAETIKLDAETWRHMRDKRIDQERDEAEKTQMEKINEWLEKGQTKFQSKPRLETAVLNELKQRGFVIKELQCSEPTGFGYRWDYYFE